MTLCENCQTKVESLEKSYILTYHGKTYICCSPECMKQLLELLD